MDLETQNVPIVGAVSSQTHEYSVLCHCSCILLSNGYRTGFMRRVLCLYSRTVLCNYVFSVID